MLEAIELVGLNQPELQAFVESIGEPAYRGRQLFNALQHRRLRSFEEMTELPKDLRNRLNSIALASTLTVESRYISEDGTRRYLMKTHDKLPVETVFIPEERRDTICFSSQSGCPLQCTFCLTAQLGLLLAGFSAAPDLRAARRMEPRGSGRRARAGGSRSGEREGAAARTAEAARLHGPEIGVAGTAGVPAARAPRKLLLPREGIEACRRARRHGHRVPADHLRAGESKLGQGLRRHRDAEPHRRPDLGRRDDGGSASL